MLYLGNPAPIPTFPKPSPCFLAPFHLVRAYAVRDFCLDFFFVLLLGRCRLLFPIADVGETTYWDRIISLFVCFHSPFRLLWLPPPDSFTSFAFDLFMFSLSLSSLSQVHNSVYKDNLQSPAASLAHTYTTQTNTTHTFIYIEHRHICGWRYSI